MSRAVNQSATVGSGRFPRLGLGVAICSALLSAYSSRKAYAGSCAGAAGTYSCSGAAGADVTQSFNPGIPLTVTTDPGFGINVGGGNAFELTGTGGVTFIDNNNSTIVGADEGIEIDNLVSGDVNITITGSVTATGPLGDGLEVFSEGEDFNLNVSSVNGNEDGINIENQGVGDFNLTAGAVTGLNGNGIEILDSGGGGSASITITGPVTGGGYYGLWFRGIPTDLRIYVDEATGQSEGISAAGSGSGSVSITATGHVRGITNQGVIAANLGTDLSVNVNSVAGGLDGIFAYNLGSGSLSITASGDVSGASRYGIYARQGPNGTTLDITADNVSGSVHGIGVVHSGSGPTSITITGAVSGATGIYVAPRPNQSAVTLNVEDRVTGTGGFAIDLRGDGHDTVNLGPGARLMGAVDFGNGNDGKGGTNPDDVDTLNILPGFNGVVRFADSSGTDSDLQSAPEWVSDNVILLDGGLLATVFDPSVFATADVFLDSFTDQINQTVADQGTLSSCHGAGDASFRGGYWLTGFSGQQDLNRQQHLVGLKQHFNGWMLGAEICADEFIWGGFAGAGRGYATLDVDAGGADLEAGFAGVYLKRKLSGYHLKVCALAGRVDQQLQRNFAGLATTVVEGRGDGWLVSPSVEVSAPVSGLPVSAYGSIALSYSGLFLDEYQETGSDYPLWVSARDLHQLSARAQLQLPSRFEYDGSGAMEVDWRLGLDVHRDLDSDKVRVSSGGGATEFDPRPDDRAEVYAGVTMRHRRSRDSLAIELSAEWQSSPGNSDAFFGEIRFQKPF
ncbi:MAG: hypothetical protein AseanaTS_10640 [Candidatus Pelagadaptatus aseana]|uniref:autotransporter outer membrane beta-barrel domain-containing protein n=1 Tax=Candidatus Pelagadaptatus aseana TaxID=3120508 RepID=UPI0039B29B35